MSAEPTLDPHADATDAADAAAAVAAARAALPAWGATSARDRARVLAVARRHLVREAQRVIDTVAAETGRVPADIAMAEVLHGAGHADWLARHAARVVAPTRVPARPAYHRVAWVTHRPRGVAAVISPWNYPFLLPWLPVTTALAAGCAVVLKPSEVTPRSGALVAALLIEAGVPEQAVQVLHGGADAGAALASAEVDVVAVTGSTATGRAVAAAAAQRLTPVIAELGGNDPLLVLPGADVERAARATVWGACFNAGQSCVSTERVYVTSAVHTSYVAALRRAFDDVAAATRDRHDVGPLVTAAQAAEVERQIADATDRGAVLATGGRRVERDGRSYVEPTLLLGADHTMAVMREETFGPVVAVMEVADTDAAVAAANDSAYALGASVWAGDVATGREVAARLRAGAVSVNDVAVNFGVPGLPFGGSGASGTGRQGGAEGLLAYCATQTVTAPRWTWPRREPQWFPRIAGEAAWRRAARALYGR